MGTKTSKFNEEGIEGLSKDKPVVYELLNKNNKNIYTGSAKRGNVEERLKDHLPRGSDAIPGAQKVKIIQKSSLKEAQKAESRIIKTSKPRYNKRGK